MTKKTIKKLKKLSPYRIPRFPKGYAGVQKPLVRSALFAATRRLGEAHPKLTAVSSLRDAVIKASGARLVQHSLNVYLACLAAGQGLRAGVRLEVKVKTLLDILGLQDGSSDRAWLRRHLAALLSSVVSFKTKKASYRGPVLSSSRMTDDGKLELHFSRAFCRAFVACYVTLSLEMRRRFRCRPLALWLQAYVASHVAPHPPKVESFHAWCGSSNANVAGYRREFVHALKYLTHQAVISKGEIDSDGLVHIERSLRIEGAYDGGCRGQELREVVRQVEDAALKGSPMNPPKRKVSRSGPRRRKLVQQELPFDAVVDAPSTRDSKYVNAEAQSPTGERMPDGVKTQGLPVGDPQAPAPAAGNCGDGECTRPEPSADDEIPASDDFDDEKIEF